jgi:hypothetical protein
VPIKAQKQPDGIISISTGYSIPWTKENIVNILKEVSLPTNSKLQCSIRMANGMKFTIESLQDLMNGTPFEELLHFGRTLTDRERKQWVEKQVGIGADIRRVVEYQRKVADSNLQQRPVTVDDVQTVIQRQIQTIQQQLQQQEEPTVNNNNKKGKHRTE